MRALALLVLAACGSSSSPPREVVESTAEVEPPAARGAWIAFDRQHDDGAPGRLHLVRVADGVEVTPEPPIDDVDEAIFSDDGGLFVTAAGRLWRVEEQGGTWRAARIGATGVNVIGVDRGRLVHACGQPEDHRIAGGLCVSDADGRRVEIVAAGSVVGVGVGGGRVFWRTFERDATVLRSRPLDGGETTAHGALAHGWPVVSPDGQRLAIVEVDRVTLVALADRDVETVTLEGWEPGICAWSPSRDALACSAIAARGDDAGLLTIDSGRRVAVRLRDSRLGRLFHAPDGSAIAVLIGAGIAVVPADGGAARTLAPGAFRLLAW